MIINVVQLKKLLFHLESLDEKLTKQKQAFSDYYDVMYPDSYPPFLYWGIDYVIEAISYLNEGLHSELEYYFFEAKNMDEAIVKYKWNNYNFTKENDFIRYLVDSNIINK